MWKLNKFICLKKEKNRKTRAQHGKNNNDNIG